MCSLTDVCISYLIAQKPKHRKETQVSALLDKGTEDRIKNKRSCFAYSLNNDERRNLREYIILRIH